jgi:uncharacterized membrane protein YoaK (UPF0700 family)
MADDPESASVLLKGGVALAVTFVGGSVDAIGYIAFYHVFTAHMTGATVNFGMDLANGLRGPALMAGSVICAFVIGSVAGRVIIEMASRIHFRRVASITLGVEILLLMAVMLRREHLGESAISPATVRGFLIYLAAAMGIQTATLTRVGPLTVHTTFVTGMLNKLGQLISHFIFENYDLLRNSGDPKLRAQRKKTGAQAAFMSAIWGLYLSGAVAGAVLSKKLDIRALYVPITLLAGAILIDCIRPLSVEEEKDQSER